MIRCFTMTWFGPTVDHLPNHGALAMATTGVTPTLGAVSSHNAATTAGATSLRKPTGDYAEDYSKYNSTAPSSAYGGLSGVMGGAPAPISPAGAPDSLSFDAAVCLGRFGVNSEEASSKLRQAVARGNKYMKAQAMEILVRQMNVKDPEMIGAILDQVRALWFKTAMNRDVSTGPLARPFARSLATLTRSLAPHYQLRSRALLRSLARSLPCSWESE